MVKFDSPLGSKSFPGQSMREFDIPNEDEPQMAPVMRQRGPSMHGSQAPIDIDAAIAFQNKLQQPSVDQSIEIERQIKEAREAKRTGREPLNDGAKRRIEMLVGMTQFSREVNLDGNIYILQTLRSKEMREAFMIIAEYDGTVQSPFEMRRQFLARSLTQVAGLDIAQFVGSNSLEAKLQLIDDLPEDFLNRLYSEYLALVKESKEKFAIKTPEEAKEVIEDLKK
jgi:hypothetical protein